MDIIIEKQNGNIVKVLELFCIEDMIKAESQCSLHILGTYKTEERAKEVMQEIKEFIKRKYTQEQYNITYNSKISEVTKDFIIDDVKRHKELAIFKMPKE
jgi:ribosomal protein L31E